MKTKASLPCCGMGCLPQTSSDMPPNFDPVESMQDGDAAMGAQLYDLCGASRVVPKRHVSVLYCRLSTSVDCPVLPASHLVRAGSALSAVVLCPNLQSYTVQLSRAMYSA